GTIQIGNVSKGDNASITNRGTENAALLDFVLPKGDKGDKGDTGDTGVQGEAGQDGVTPTIVAGNTVTLSPGSSAQVKSTTTGTTTVFDFLLPTGPKGDTGSRWYVGNETPDASTGIQDERGVPRSGDMYLQLAAAEHEAKTYIKLNNGEWSEPLGMVAGPEGKPASI
ncbi:unnamed protein product, partial [Commensalibacter communis]